MKFLSFVKLGCCLDRFVNEEIFEPIVHSDWAAPIVSVINPDNSIRICGDYKQTINQAFVCDKYLIPGTRFICFIRWEWKIHKTWFKTLI